MNINEYLRAPKTRGSKLTQWAGQHRPPTSVVTGPAVKSRSVFGALRLFIGAWSRAIKSKAFRAPAALFAREADRIAGVVAKFD